MTKGTPMVTHTDSPHRGAVLRTGGAVLRITDYFTRTEIQHIACHLTEEARQQATLYGIADVSQHLWVSMGLSQEAGVFRINGDIISNPVAAFGLTYGPKVDSLFMAITEYCLIDYLPFARCCREWLNARKRRIWCTLPDVSSNTITMLTKWGFTFIGWDNSGDFPKVTMEYDPNL